MPDRFSIRRIFQITPMSTPGNNPRAHDRDARGERAGYPPTFRRVEEPRHGEAEGELQGDRRDHEDERHANHARELRIADASALNPCSV